MTFEFHLPQLELRAKETDGKPAYIVKGYAIIPKHTYTYKTTPERSFKEYFSEKAMNNLKKKLKSQKVFVDAEHIIGTKHSSGIILDQLNEKTNKLFSKEIDYIKDKIKFSDIPMFKVEDMKIDDNGLFVEIKGNPYYREVDVEHQKYFDAIWSSLEKKYIDGMSISFKPTATIQVNDGLTQIDDLDLYGISLTGSAASEMTSITEVAMRSVENIRGEEKCLMKKKTSSLML